ncbi:OmpA family protein [Qipengyuania sp. XHP0207]|uniref:OmpA family protein n=1 Tax=Qipengyuania sp. XHP0207 TaxID=3038078 RepID=UPI0024204766|nr:OmpA family protein [Qipengyuania sp. XHP0207]MDG5746967.1 OmpA family protein [Qipengyuania sp. XHP0207]
MSIRPSLAILAGAVVVAAGGYAYGASTAGGFVAGLEDDAAQAIAEAGGSGVSARFANRNGSPTRHPLLSGGEKLDEQTRARVAEAVSSVAGVGGVVWSDGTVRAESDAPSFEPLHCQEDVDGLLRSRSIRFEEASSALLPASGVLLDEVADALRPCLGAIISITGHTDKSGTEPGNLALSMERARAVREALVRRGIPRDGLRARGVGSSEPVEGLAPGDPANRRIEFAVIRTEPLRPTPVDTPGAR